MPLQEWLVITQDIRTHSGKYRHQGGIIIYVLEGKGYPIVDDERIDWEKGDLVLLPIKRGGVEHQHFNGQPGQPCRGWHSCIFPEMVQMENSPGEVFDLAETRPNRIGHSVASHSYEAMLLGVPTLSPPGGYPAGAGE